MGGKQLYKEKMTSTVLKEVTVKLGNDNTSVQKDKQVYVLCNIPNDKLCFQTFHQCVVTDGVYISFSSSEHVEVEYSPCGDWETCGCFLGIAFSSKPGIMWTLEDVWAFLLTS